MWKLKTKIIPVVINPLGMMKKGTQKYIDEIPGKRSLYIYLFKIHCSYICTCIHLKSFIHILQCQYLFLDTFFINDPLNHITIKLQHK